MNAKSVFRFAALLILALGFATSASAGWTVTSLHPAGATDSTANGVSGDQQVGYANFSGNLNPRAGVWSGTAGSWVDLGPGYAYAASGGQQVGQAGAGHAVLWRGTAASKVDLHPSWMIESKALGTDGSHQVGYAKLSDYRLHAGMWSGTAASWLDLNPAGSTHSVAYAICNGQQVGYTMPVSSTRAALWNGTAASWVDLSAGRGSIAMDTDGTEQVGSLGEQAALWRGTAASYVNLHPTGTLASSARATSGGWQAGYASLGVYQETHEPYGYYEIGHAMLWHGTAASAFDLHSLLGGSFDYSQAMDIQAIGNELWVAGYAYQACVSPAQAILWHYTPDVVPEPSSLLALGSGLLALGGLIRRRR